MESRLYRISLWVAVLVVSIVAAVLIHRRGGVSYRTMLFDVLCYCGGGVLFGNCLLAIFAIWFSHSLEQSVREAWLGWVGIVPVPVWVVLALLGAFIFGARWRYKIRHRSPINPLQPTADRSAASGG